MNYGLFINDKQQVSFNFDGQHINAFDGDTIATALWRSGISTLSRSFKYHRRRSILSLSAADANTLMDMDDAPNICAARTLAKNGTVVRSRHCWGNAENDWLAYMNLLSPILPPGFYYKAFFRPQGAWPKWEPLIRRLAGIGKVNPAAPHQVVEKIHDSCDVAIIGGGAAGMQAALTAAAAGNSVRLLDKNSMLGGAMLWRGHAQQAQTTAAEITATDNIKSFLSCEATSVFDDNMILAQGEDYSLRLRAKKIIYATGARALPLVFPNNDLPGIMLLSAALRLAFLYDLRCGANAVVIAYCAADADAIRALQAYGITIKAVFNLAEPDADWAKALSNEGLTVFHTLSKLSAVGRRHVSAIHAYANNKKIEIDCDCVLINGGDVATAELPAAAGVVFEYDDVLQKPIAHSLPDNIALAGALNNRNSLTTAIEDGAAAAANTTPPPADDTPLPTNVFFTGDKGKAFVDFEEDLQCKDLDDAISEGFDDIQLLKRYTTAGMGPAQGKLGNILVMRHLAKQNQCAVSTVGQITARPPAAAETLAQLAEHPHPTKLTAMHSMHVHLSAKLMPAGVWLRPASYSDAAEESQAVRTNAGIIDISTLGKMQISGANAAEFLERLYTGKFTTQKPGTVRYALMLDESGIIVDDGVVACTKKNHFWVTTTTGNADNIYRQMLLWRTRWKLQVDIINMTSAYAAINLAGPNAPAILADIYGKKIDLGYMKNKEIQIGGVNALIMRVGFVGEKGYEIHLPSGYAAALWNTCLNHATPFGVETQRLLRLEKGHIIVGQDTDGLTTPMEAGMEWALGRDKEFYLGQRALEIHRQRGIALRLCGFVLGGEWLEHVDESDLILNPYGDAIGRVTSISYSPTQKCIIGLAYADADTPMQGGTLRLRTAAGEVLQAKTVATPFYDPQGEQQQ
ncbi:MAG: 2Fe-2S iron-sulfur cluster-binding protein [Gammaproteobacteria bacterium WSBS_2016_MAG_OTU1]